VQRLRAPAPAKPAHTFGNRAGRYEHNVFAGLAQGRDLFRPGMDGRKIQAATVIGDQRAADLDYPAGRFS